MNVMNNGNKIRKWLSILFGASLIVSFFLPWVSWQGYPVSGYDMPKGYFFNLAETKFSLGNPFPQFSFSFWLFWLIPLGVLASIVLLALNKKWSLAAFITGALSLSLLTVFYLFTQKLIMLGVGRNIFAMLQPAAWWHAVSALALIVIAPVSHALLKKLVWVAAGPVFVFIGFLLMENYIMGETFSDTAGVKADYTVSAADLIHEFMANDSTANKKYREKIIGVKGAASGVEAKSDSTVNIKFADSTGSYIIFSLGKDEYDKAKDIKAGDTLSLKGSCSGSVYSEILGTTSINFKRSTLNKK